MQFPQGSSDDLVALIRAFPLAWLVSHGEAGFHATPLPLVPETDASGALVALVGHCSRANAQVAALQADPRALILFSGPQGYVSPALVSKPQWAPTWNYAVASFAVEVDFAAPATQEAVEMLIDQSEQGQPQPWTLDQAGNRAQGLLARVIGFRARVVDGGASFKLGQDEDDLSFAEILAGLGEGDLVAWMQRLNPGRA